MYSAGGEKTKVAPNSVRENRGILLISSHMFYLDFCLLQKFVENFCEILGMLCVFGAIFLRVLYCMVMVGAGSSRCNLLMSLCSALAILYISPPLLHFDSHSEVVIFVLK